MRSVSSPEPGDKSSGSSSGGLYRNVKIPVRTLDIVIVGLLLVVVIFTAIGRLDPGFTVQFDARGGSDVESMKLQYGDVIPEPEPPTREGYVFRGWFTDPNGSEAWDFTTMTVTDNTTLYAAWEQIGQPSNTAETQNAPYNIAP